MDLWLIDGLECDPLEWWVELMNLCGSSEVKTSLRVKGSRPNMETGLKEGEDYSLVKEMELGPINGWLAVK